MSIFLISITALIALAIAGAGVYRVRKFERTFVDRIDLVLRAIHTCTHRVRITSEKIDKLEKQNESSMTYQIKANEHQRVLLASLTRQIRQLENHLTSTAPATTSREEQGDATQVHKVKDLKEEVRSASKIIKSSVRAMMQKDNAVIRLEDMFKDVNPEIGTAPKPVEVDLNKDLASQVRRVANG